MTGAQNVAHMMQQIPENKLIFVSKLYREVFKSDVSEAAYYQTIGRMCRAGRLCKIAKGVYYRPKTSRYGVIPPTQREIISTFTVPDKGTVVGYSLYNQLKLTTQIPKTVEIFSSELEQRTKNINNVVLYLHDLVYTTEVKEMIHALDVLQNFDSIQDLNYRQFVKYSEGFANKFDNDVFEHVIQKVHYQKRTIAFLRSILVHYGVKNDLGKHLSSLSKYKHPTMEEIYEIAYAT